MKQKPLAVWISFTGIAFLVIAVIRYAVSPGNSALIFIGTGVLVIILSNVLFYTTLTKQVRQQYKTNLILNWVLIGMLVAGAVAYGMIVLFVLFLLKNADVSL